MYLGKGLIFSHQISFFSHSKIPGKAVEGERRFILMVQSVMTGKLWDREMLVFSLFSLFMLPCTQANKMTPSTTPLNPV